MKQKIFLLLLLAAALSGCAGAAAGAGDAGIPALSPTGKATSAANTAVQETVAAIVAATQEAVPTATSTEAAPTETPTPTASSTPEPTATATPHPMSIAAQRALLQAGAFPGSDITIEQELDPGANYYRYYASYLSDGLKIYALLTVPYGEPPEGGWPAIVFNHGYIPPTVYRTTERYINYVDGLARSGYIVFRIDYRGHDRSEGQARGAYGDPGYLADVLNAVASIQRFPQANPQKIGMWGHSMGGYLTLRAMVISPDIKAGVIWAGVVGSYPDMMYRWRRSGPNPVPTAPSFSRRWRQEWLQLYGTPEENPEFWASVSANTYVGDLSGPLQLHHGTADEDVPTEFSENLARQIQDAGGTVELYIYPGDNHNLSGYFTQAMARQLEFYERYLK